MKIAVIGMGYVGCVTAAVLAREGHDVVGVDISEVKIDALNQGVSPILEPGLSAMVKEAHAAGRLTATTDGAGALSDAQITMVCVGTPSESSGAVSTTALRRVSEQIGKAFAGRTDYPVMVLRSTVLPTIVIGEVIPRLEKGAGCRVGDGFGLAVNPEFLREGTAIEDFYKPEFTLFGCDDKKTEAPLREMYGFLDADFVFSDLKTAGLVKYANNAFHAVKVAFANELSRVGDHAGIDTHEVMRLVCLDKKLNISPAYMKPGTPFGGSCLPKDTRALVHFGRSNGLNVPLLSATLDSNRAHRDMSIARILEHAPKRIGMFGVAFKAGTDDLRESPLVEIVETLIGKGLEVAVYDRNVSPPDLVGANQSYMSSHIPHIAKLLLATIEEMVERSDVLVIGTKDPDFKRIPELMRPDQVLIDLAGACRN